MLICVAKWQGNHIALIEETDSEDGATEYDEKDDKIKEEKKRTENILSLVFDTTASGACTLIEKHKGKAMLWLSC